MRLVPKSQLLSLFFAAYCGLPLSASACPRISGVIDRNCDSAVNVIIVGDSIVAGAGDIESETDSLRHFGYAGRVQELLPNVRFRAFGFRGITSQGLLRRISGSIEKQNALGRALRTADIVIVDAGRNDFFSHVPYREAARRMERIVSLIKASPGFPRRFVANTTLSPSRRIGQAAFVDRFNNEISKPPAKRNRLGPNFAELNAYEDIGPDGLHPGPVGYERMAYILADFLVSLTR